MSLVIFITLNISKHVEQILSVINITSDIKLVSNSSTIIMMHGPINIRLTIFSSGKNH